MRWRGSLEVTTAGSGPACRRERYGWGQECGSNVIPAQEALARLREGNRRFVDNGAASGGRPGAGQQPFAIVLGCSDSRVPAELVFGQGFGDLFVIRVAGRARHPGQYPGVGASPPTRFRAARAADRAGGFGDRRGRVLRRDGSGRVLRRKRGLRSTITPPPGESTTRTIGGHEVTISNPDKVLFPKPKYTKLDLANYYLAVSEEALHG